MTTPFAMDDHMRRVVELVMTNRENYLTAWIAETGLSPTECELVEDTTNPLCVRLFVRRRDKSFEWKFRQWLMSEFGTDDLNAASAKALEWRQRSGMFKVTP